MIKTNLGLIGIFTILIIVFLITRLYNLISLPIFTDEAIYIRWAQIAGNDASWRFISLTDGKQPLFIWFIIPMLSFFSDPLFSARFVSVLSGLVTMFGLFFLTRELFQNKWVGVLAAFLYVIYPMALVYDRIALYDAMVGSFTVWALYVEVLLVRRVRLDIALILAFILGGAMLTKTNGFFSAAFLPVTLLLFDWKQQQAKKKFISWVIYACISFCIAYLYYSVLRLSPFFHVIEQKNATFVYPLAEWITHPFLGFIGNGRALTEWFVSYMTLPLVLLLIGSFFAQKSFFREKIILVLLFLIPFVYLAFFGKVIYPRYIFPMTLVLLPLCAMTLFTLMVRVQQKAIRIAIYLIFLAFPFYSSYQVLADFSKAPIPQSDINQYNNDWPSGHGVKEVITFLENESKKGPIYVVTEGTFGLMPYALEIYLVQNPNITIKGLWPIDNEPPIELTQVGETMPVYALFYQPCPSCSAIYEAPPTWPLDKITQITRGNGTVLTLYKLRSQ